MASIAKKASAFVLAALMAAAMCLVGFAGTTQTAYADETDGTSTSIQILVDGEEIDTVTQDSLTGVVNDKGELILHEDNAAYLYLMGNGNWHVAQATDYVTLEDLFAAVGVEDDWTSGASLEFTTYNWDEATQTYTEGVYNKWPNFTYDFINGVGEGNMMQNKFYGDTKQKVAGTDGTPLPEGYQAIIAFNYATQMIPADGTAQSVADSLKVTGAADTRFMMGLNSNTVDQPVGQGDNMGKRFPSAITKINIVTGA